MRTYLLALVCALACHVGFAQTLNKSFTDSKGRTKLLGQATYKRLKQKPFKEWFVPNEKAYEVSEDTVKLLEELIQTASADSITIFMGTWCGDSKREVPKFTKLLKQAGFRFEKMKIVCVDNQFSMYKQSPDGEEMGQNIHRVPTILFHKAAKEIGRIVETPVESMSADVLKILGGKPYEPNYRGVVHLNTLLTEKPVSYLKKNFDQVVEELKPLVQSESELNTYSYIFASRRQLGLARQVLLLNQALFPDKERPCRNLGWILSDMGEYQKALKAYQQALAINPENKRTQQIIAWLEKEVE